MKKILKNAIIVTMNKDNEIIKNGQIEIENNLITYVGVSRESEGEEIDIKGYLENIEKQKYINKCEKIKNNILNENKYENFQNDFCVDEEQLDKVKIKIKKLNRDL